MNKIIVTISLLSIILMNGCESPDPNFSLKKGDWPQYRADAGRTGYTPTNLPRRLTLRWQHQQLPPDPAWQGIHTRMPFDFAYQPIVAGRTLYFGSSADGKVYALNAATGKERWSFYTDAPIRFAPIAWRDWIFVAGDDGYLYCLSTTTGKLRWKKRCTPSKSMVLGNDRLISRWPARGGLALKDNILYFGAGIWPSEGIFIYALDPETGRERWVNDNSGGLEWDQPHPTARAKSGISAQGYLVAAGEHLFVPTGRAVPAALNLVDGALDYFHLQKYRNYGGSRVMATDSCLLITGGNSRNDKEIIGKRQALFNNRNGHLLTTNDLPAQALAITPEFLIYFDANDHKIKAISREKLTLAQEITNRKGQPVTRQLLAAPTWTIDSHQSDAVSMIVAGQKVVVGTENQKVVIFDIRTKSTENIFEVDGIPYGLAAAHQRLYVSTSKGTIYCFDSKTTGKVDLIEKRAIPKPYRSNVKFTQAAEEIIAKTGITEGFCVDFGCGSGQLTYEIARRTNLQIYAVDEDPQNVAFARKKLDQAGLYGTRVTVHCAALDSLPYPPYFADLIVSGRTVLAGAAVLNDSNFIRIQRPAGGISCFGKPGEMQLTRRAALPGSGEWTHQYADPGNTIASIDERLKGPLGILWFRDDQMEMPSRHGRGVGPLYQDGRLFIQGNHGIRAIDAYNGRTLWEYHIENLMKPYDQEHLTGTAQTHGNWCLENGRLYVRPGPSIANITGRKCLVLDAAGGKKIKEFRVPPRPDQQGDAYWGYVAIEKGTLFGTIINQEHVTKWAYRESEMNQLFSESVAFFALDAESGELKWLYPAKYSIRHNAIAIGNGKVFLIDRPPAMQDRLRNPHAGTTKNPIHAPGILLALDAESGKLIYKNKNDIYGTLLAFSAKYDLLLMTHQYTRFRAPSETRDKMTVFHASQGKRLWEIDITPDKDRVYHFSSRPVINDSLVFLEPNAYDLLTGKRLDFQFNRTYACGIITSAKNMMLFRSSTVGYFDLTAPEIGTQNYGGIRPGCWINTLPVGGLVLMPDATDRCNCSYLNKASIALIPLNEL